MCATNCSSLPARLGWVQNGLDTDGFRAHIWVMFYFVLMLVVVCFAFVWVRIMLDYVDNSQRWNRANDFVQFWFMAFGVGAMVNLLFFNQSPAEQLGLGAVVSFLLAGRMYWKQL